MDSDEDYGSAAESAVSSRSKLRGNQYELGLFLFVLTSSPESLAFDIGKEVDVADKFDDVVIRIGNEYTCLQAKLEDKTEENLLDPDVLIGRKPLLNGRFHLLKYFVSYLRIKDQFESSDNKILKKLIIFTNTKLENTVVSHNDIELISINKSADTAIHETHSEAQWYKIKEASEGLKKYLRQFLKPDLEILSAELAKFFSPFDHQFVYDKDSTFSSGILRYYYRGLIREGIIEKITEKNAKFTKNFIKNINLSSPAKVLRTALIKFIQENTYGKVDEELLKNKLNNPKLPVSEGKKVKYHYVTPSRLLLQALTNHIILADKCISLNVESFRYYHTALIESVIMTKKVRKGKKQVREGTISKAFIENAGSLPDAVGKLRELIPTSIKLHAQKLENYFSEAIRLEITGVTKLEQHLKEVRSLKNFASARDQRYLKKSLGDVKVTVSDNFGRTKRVGMKISLPSNSNITEESIDNFVDVLEFRLNELNLEDLFKVIKNDQIKNRFLMYFNWDPEHLARQIRDFIEIWKDSEGSQTEGWILNSKRKKFIKKLETDISRPIANHKTWEYKRDLKRKIEEFDIRFKNYAPFQASYFETKGKIFYVKTESVLLSAIKMLNYLKGRNEDLIFMNVGSLANKEEFKKLANSFQDDKFKLLILSYELSLDNEFVKELLDALAEILKNHPKKIFVITSASEDGLDKDKFQIVPDKDISLVDFENPSKILEHKVMFQGEPTALKMLINTDDVNSLKLVTAKTLDEIFKNKPIRIGCRPFSTSDLLGAFAHLSEEVNKETLTNLICNSAEIFFVISGILYQDIDHAKNQFIERLGLSLRNERSKCDVILKKINFLARPYSITPTDTVIQLVDSKFEESDFQKFCSVRSKKMVFWVKWVQTKFELQQIHNSDFYMDRNFNKVIVDKNVIKVLKLTKDQLVFNGVDKNELALLFELGSNELDQARVFLEHNTEAARKKFNELNNTVHWLEVETKNDHKVIVWRNSKGSLKNLREHIDEEHPANLGQEKELLQFLEDKQAVIIADDPGMGKSTTLVKLYRSEGGHNDLLSSHWVINVNLRDHLQAIRAILDTDINEIKSFLSKVSQNLDSTFPQNLLAFAFCAGNNPKKSLLITFDGFDEMLDEADRMKVISLLTALKQKTCVKFWVTTRRQHQKLLEDALSTFSVTFQPLDKIEQEKFIINFFRDRLRLLLTQNKFNDIFCDCFNENSKMYKYAICFLKKMKSVFVKNLQRFIGTPLQLNLLLGVKGSLEEFKKWGEIHSDSEPDFVYLGKNVLEVYGNFITGKYETYSKRVGIEEEAKKNYYFKHWISDCKCLAESKFLFKSVNSLLDHEAMVLAPGLIKSHGNNMEFIHSTFGEYFVSERFVRWMGKNLNPSKQKKLIEKFLIDDNYQVIRWFINARLPSKLEAPSEETLREYERIIWRELHNLPEVNRSEARSPLHTAAREGNENIVAFLCSIVKNNKDLLKTFVEMHNRLEHNALHIASWKGHDHVIKKLFEPFRDDKTFLKHLLKSYRVVDENSVCAPGTALCMAVGNCHVKTVETLLEPFSDDKEFLKELISCFKQTNRSWFESSPSNAGRNWGTMLHVAVERGFDQIVEKLFQYFTNDNEFLKVLMKTPCDRSFKDRSFRPYGFDYGWTALHGAAMVENLNVIVIEKLITPISGDENFLGKLIGIQTKDRKSTALHFLARHKDSCDTIHKLLKSLTNDKREKLIRIPAELGNTVLHSAALNGNDNVVQQLLNYFTNSTKEELLKIPTDSGRTVFHSAVESGDSNTVERVLEYFTDKLECLKMGDLHENSSLHIACIEGHPNIVHQLLTFAKDFDKNWEAFKKVIKKPNEDGKTAFEIATNTVEINEVVKEFIEQANAEKATEEIVGLLSKARNDLSSNPKERRGYFDITMISSDCSKISKELQEIY